MWLTARLRVLIAFVAAVPVGWVYMVWGLQAGRNIFRVYDGGGSRCSDSYWHDLGNNCGASFSVGLAWFELVLAGLIVVGIGWLLARWALFPVRAMAGTVAKLGPTSLDVRLRATGPSDETRQLSDAIDHLLDRVAVGYEAQRRFAANASHELRTPLATQRALIEVSLSSALTPEQLELLSRQLLATNERNERLVDGLLTLAETDGGLVANAPLRLDQIVAETVESLRGAAGEREVEIETVLDPVTVSGERPLLERLANNLLINAIKYNYPGGTVIATVTQDGAFTVVNTGPEIAPEQMARLFEPFRRGSGERLDHGGGVGLGLTIARSIVTAHGAAIHARANPGGGLTITVRLSAG